MRPSQSGIPDVLFGAAASDGLGTSSTGRGLGKGGNGARWWAPVRFIRCNQVKKDEGASCAWTDAAEHRKKDRQIAAPNTLNCTNKNRLSRST
jgi:hypothetical protein